MKQFQEVTMVCVMLVMVGVGLSYANEIMPFPTPQCMLSGGGWNVSSGECVYAEKCATVEYNGTTMTGCIKRVGDNMVYYNITEGEE